MSNTLFNTTENTFYIVQYNDRYGNGNDKSYECIVKSKDDFLKWLKEHNKERKGMGAMPESAEEFDLIPINLWTPLTNS
jgi:phosphopantetheine adenylyltransferase